MQEAIRNIQLNLSLPEVNQILTALGEQPYSAVYHLIAKIQQQAITEVDSGEGLINPPSRDTVDHAKGTD